MDTTTSSHLEAGYTGSNRPDPSVLAIDVFLILIIIASIFGNLLVFVAVAFDRQLRKPGNYFIASLAVADLLVAVLVMPFSLSTDVVDHRVFGVIFCNAWVSFDVMFSSTSLLHICAISIDRYFNILEPFKYKRRMTKTVAMVVVVFLWTTSALKSFLPIFLGLSKGGPITDTLDDISNSNPTQLTNIENDSVWRLAGFIFCDHSFNTTYAITTSIIDFFFPCIIIVVVYARIFHIVTTRSRNLRLGRLPDMARASAHARSGKTAPKFSDSCRVNTQHRSDRKAAVMLGMIIGFFLVCWLPFFVNLLACSIQSCHSFYSSTDQILTWLGYVNSCMNPCIYSISNPEFRHSFKNLLHHAPRTWAVARARRLSLVFSKSPQPPLRVPTAQSVTSGPSTPRPVETQTVTPLPISSIGIP